MPDLGMIAFQLFLSAAYKGFQAALWCACFILNSYQIDLGACQLTHTKGEGGMTSRITDHFHRLNQL
jgi:hypothetical protein